MAETNISAQPTYLGVTPPVSTNYPTPMELDLTKSLEKSLGAHNLFESPEEARKREIVLGKLDKMVKDFVYRVSVSKMDESIAREAGGKIFTFGSYRLGVHGTGADIDTLCVVPKNVLREDFFETMYEMLKERPEVAELTPVPDAYVPVIKMHFSGIPIDLVCARLALARVPDDLELKDDNLLKNLDERCIRSLNGSRVTDEILRLVPNIPAFRIALRCVKLWAKQRAVYSNMMGFLGGVAWAMLVARICQLYPNACAGAIVSKFFRIVYQWKWPQPILLKNIEGGPLQVRVWNPKLYPADKAHRMPIITPAYPSMCATHNVTQSTHEIMKVEFNRADGIINEIMTKKTDWSELFSKHDFFTHYRYYLQVIATSDSAEMQLKWAGMVESRIRQLVMKLEGVPNLVLAHPFIKGFEKVYQCSTDQEALDVAHGVYKPVATVSSEVTHREGSVEVDGPELVNRTVHSTTFYIGLLIEPRGDGVTGPRKLDITWPALDFCKMVKGWDKYDENSMAIVVKNIKSAQLPRDTLEEGEQQPKKLKRAKSTSKSKTSNPKRLKPNANTCRDQPTLTARSETSMSTYSDGSQASGTDGSGSTTLVEEPISLNGSELRGKEVSTAQSMMSMPIPPRVKDKDKGEQRADMNGQR